MLNNVFKSISLPRRPHTLTSNTTSRSFHTTLAGEVASPYNKQFVHSKSSQYKRLKTEWKTNVYLARSQIQVSDCNAEFTVWFILRINAVNIIHWAGCQHYTPSVKRNFSLLQSDTH